MTANRSSEIFDQYWQNKNQISPENQRVKKAIQVLSGGQRLLDIGCGDGNLGASLTGRYAEVFGVDIAAKAVELARAKGVNAIQLNLNEYPLPYPDLFFDSVTLLSVLQYFYDIESVLAECHRVLRPEGEILLSSPNMRAFWRLYRLTFQGRFPRTSIDLTGYDGGALHYFCYQNMVELLEQRGFKVILGRGIFCLPHWANQWTDRGLVGWFKREFLGAEFFVRAVKLK